ncbi:MAG: hypothetical protein IKK29_03705 [Christensenellaceae bacterium]|nr:hypothetical protein [Christensenellaceae bacterium]
MSKLNVNDIRKIILRERVELAKRKMERLRKELNLIVVAIKNDPERNINCDAEVLAKNKELTAAIQEFLILEKRLNGKNSRYSV